MKINLTFEKGRFWLKVNRSVLFPIAIQKIIVEVWVIIGFTAFINIDITVFELNLLSPGVGYLPIATHDLFR